MASQIARIFYIDQKIRTSGRVTIQDIMHEGDVAQATAKRDIEALRDRLNAPLHYDHKLRGYVYNKEFKLLDFAGEQLFLFYVLALGIVKNQNYLPLTAEYARSIIIENIGAILPENYSRISGNFIYENSEYEEMNFQVLGTIMSSMMKKKCCILDYLTKAVNLNRRTIEPLRVICYGTKWYLAAYCHTRKEIRIFSFSRMQKLEITETENFSNRYAPEEIAAFLNQSFGIAKTKEVQTAKIRFYEPSSFFLKKQIWHKEQKIVEYLEDGQNVLEMQVPYSKPEELVGKVLKYGATAEILEPKELRDFWLGEIKRMNERFFKCEKIENVRGSVSPAKMGEAMNERI